MTTHRGEEARRLPARKRAARSIACPRCGVAIGEPCRAPSGRTTSHHSARTSIVQHAQNIGYEEGLRDALDLLDWQVRTHGVNTTPAQIRDQIDRQYASVFKHNTRQEAQR